jgi:hypothetical protein
MDEAIPSLTALSEDSNMRTSPAPRSARIGLLVALVPLACTGAISSQPPGSSPPGTTPPPGTDPGPTPPPNNVPPGPPLPPPNMPPPDPSACAAPAARIWALTPEQYVRTVKSVLPGATLTADALAGALGAQQGFSNVASRLGLTEPYVGQLLELGYGLASTATADPAKLAPCLAMPAPTDACVKDFVTGFAGRGFRRDLAPAEVDALVMQYRKAAADTKAALRELVMAVVTSPSFLFRTELGPEGAKPGVVTLTSFEKASALSYFLTDGPPDTELLAAARMNALETKVQLEAQTRRLLSKADTAVGFTKFTSEAYQTHAVLSVDKDVKVFPDWKDPIDADLAAEADGLLRQVIWSEDGKLPTLFTAPFSMLNTRLAKLYGVTDAVPATGSAKVNLPAGQRAGLFTLGAIQASLAEPDDTNAVQRGLFVRENLLCQQIPDPPADLAVVPPPLDGKNTMRERLAHHSAEARCMACHQLLDPLGLAFEIYDGIGKYRTMDVGKPIDASGKLTNATPEGAPFANAVELMKLLSTSPDVASCFVTTAFRYTHGRPAGAQDACAVDRLARRFASTGGHVIDLMVAITPDDSFFQRQLAN